MYESQKKHLQELVNRYNLHRDSYTRSGSDYSELDLRTEFIDELFILFGWDIRNRSAKPQRYRDVLREARVNIDNRIKRPDYEFRLGTQRKFFVEAKRPSVDILSLPESAFQIRRYGWSAGLSLSILTNFEYLIVYDTSRKPSFSDRSEHSRIHVFFVNDYVDRFDELANIFSKEAVYSGRFDDQISQIIDLRQRQTIDNVFLDVLDSWRIALGNELFRVSPDIDEALLNEVAQRLIHRILFLRMCEDREILPYENLKTVANDGTWQDFLDMMLNADHRFDSSLFDVTNDPLFDNARNIQIDKDVLCGMVNKLYYPDAPYTFSVFDSEFLGLVYEFFLLKRLTINNNEVILQSKPENINRDVVFTPRLLVDYIVQSLLEPALADLDLENLLAKKIIDPACGSGGFLLSAFDFLINRFVDYYRLNNDQTYIFDTGDGWQLSFDKKKDILINCLYGVDRDIAATEVTRFSLLVKLLEGENLNSLPRGSRVLPALTANIVYGDSLIDDSIFSRYENPQMIGTPLTWSVDIHGPFDFVIGNPPYLKTEDMVNVELVEYNFYKEKYRSAHKQFDKYYLFIERALDKILSSDGRLCFVIPNKFFHIESGKKLRGLLSRGNHIYRLIDFGNSQLFDGKTTYTCLLYLAKRGALNIDVALRDVVEYELIENPIEMIATCENIENLHFNRISRDLVSTDKSWVLPSNQTEEKLINCLMSDSTSLGQLFDVFNGIQTSANDVYVLKEWNELNSDILRFKVGDDYVEIEKSITQPFFHDGHLKSFYPLPLTARLIFPYEIVLNDGRLTTSLISPSRLTREFPKTHAWLLRNEERLRRRDIRPRPFPENEWYRFGRDQALTVFENRPKIVVGVNSLGDKYVYDESNTLLASGGTAGECAIAHFGNNDCRSGYNILFILALLNHKSIEYFCRKRGSSFRGGWFARGTAVLSDLPVSNIDFTTDNLRKHVHDEIVELTRQISNIGVELTGQLTDADRVSKERRFCTLKQQIDDKISGLYGIAEIINQIELPR